MVESNTKGKVKKACYLCRRRKIRCNGFSPCHSCITLGKECKYDGTDGIKKVPLNSNKFHMYRELDNMVNSFNALKALPVMNTEMMSRDLSQMEATLVDYRKRLDNVLDLQSLSSYDDDQCIEKTIFDSEYLKFGKFSNHEVNTYYGLYNPASLESIGSFGWILQKLDLTKNESKSTIFFFLKYLDFATKYYSKLMIIRSSPSKWLRSKFKNLENLSNETSFIVESLSKELSFDLDFKKDNFELVSNFITEMRKFNTHSPRSLGCFKKRIEQEETVLALGYTSLKSSVLFEMHNLNSISNILSFLEATHWQMELQSIGRFVATAVRQSLDMGLARWEFYLHLSESQAEHRRELWWKCFWWDRWYSLLSGKPFLIDEDCVLCLFPRSITILGARNSMSLSELLELFKSDEKHLYFYIILSKIITNVLRGIGYNKKYTGWFQDSEFIIQDLLREYNKTIEYFDILQKKFNPFSRDKVEYNNISLCFFYSYTQICCISVFENILWRIRKQPDPSLIRKNTALSQEILLHVLQMDAPNLFYIFAGPITNILVAFVFSLLENNISVCDLTILCRTATLFEDLDKELDNEVDEATCLNSYKVLCFRAYIITRICLEYHMNNTSSSKSELITAISEIDIKASEVCQKLTDKTSETFEPLIRNTEMSNFHLYLLKIFNNEIGTNFSEKVQKAIEEEFVSPLSPFGGFNPFQGIQEVPMTGFDELDAFLNSKLCLDNLRDMW